MARGAFGPFVALVRPLQESYLREYFGIPNRILRGLPPRRRMNPFSDLRPMAPGREAGEGVERAGRVAWSWLDFLT